MNAVDLRDVIRRVSTQSVSLADAARLYSEAGLAVFPLQPRRKEPYVGSRGHLEASSDPSTVARLWRRYPDANIGCVPGRSGHLVVDIDGPSGEVSAHELAIDGIRTPTVQTGRREGGRHLWFVHPGGTVGNNRLAEKIDIRADKGYVVLPPSKHPTGTEYRWTNVDASIAQLPDTVLATLQGSRQPNKEPIGEGGRNTSLTSYLGRLRRDGADHDELEAEARKFNAERCTPPLPDSEVCSVVKSILRYPPGDAESADIIEGLSRRYAVIRIGGNARVMDTSEDPPVFLRREEFRLLEGNKYAVVAGKQTPVADLWLRSPLRRQYERAVFAPGIHTPDNVFNWWRGWGVESRAGDCSLFLTHIRENVCGGDESLARWVIAWFAQIFQAPTTKPGTAIALRGRQGTGKTMVGQIVGRLLGRSYTLVASSHRVIGQFNSHMESALLLHADEAIWAGDKQGEGVLKSLVTSEFHHVERKGVDAIEVPNFLRLLFTSNNDWVVPAGLEERRFCVIDVDDRRMQDKRYFGALLEQMNNGGYEALLDYFLTLDIADVDLRTIPTTSALYEQKMATLTPEQSWWLDILENGVVPGDAEGRGESPRDKVFESYINHAMKTGRRRRSSETIVGTFLKKSVPGLERINLKWGDKVVSGYGFPPLDVCRKSFESLTRHPRSWDGPGDWLPDPHCRGDALDTEF